MSTTRESIIRSIELLRQNPFETRLVQDLFSLYRRENLINNNHVQLMEHAETALKLVERYHTKEEGRKYTYLLLPPTQFIIYGITPPKEISIPVRTSDGVGTTFQKGMTSISFASKTFSIDPIKTMSNSEKPYKGFSEFVRIFGDVESLTPLSDLPARRIFLNDLKNSIVLDWVNQDLEEIDIKACRNFNFSFLRTMPIKNIRKISIDNPTIKTHQIEDLIEFIIFNKEFLAERYHKREESPFISYTRYLEFELDISKVHKNIKLDCLERLKGLGIPIHLSFWLLNRSSNPLFSLRDTFKDSNVLLKIH